MEAVILQLILLSFDVYRAYLVKQGKTDAEIRVIIASTYQEVLKRPAADLPEV